MPRIRIVQPGWTSYTGDLHTVAFTDGLSDVSISDLKAQQLAANLQVEDNAAPGVPYGEATGILPMSRGANQPARNTAGVANDLDAEIEALKIENADQTARIEALEAAAV